MKTFAKTLLVILFVAVSSNVPGAQIPPGTYNASFSRTNGNACVWDLSGSYAQQMLSLTNLTGGDIFDVLGLTNTTGVNIVDAIASGTNITDARIADVVDLLGHISIDDMEILDVIRSHTNITDSRILNLLDLVSHANINYSNILDVIKSSTNITAGTVLGLFGLTNITEANVMGVVGYLLSYGTLNYTLNMEPSGKFSGQGTISVNISDEFWDAFASWVNVSANVNLTLNGNVKSAGGVTRVLMNMKMTGNVGVAAAAQTVTFDASVKQQLEIDPARLRLVGPATGRINAAIPALKKKKTWAIKQTVEVPLPPGMTGGWDLTLNLTQSGTKYLGDAAVALSNGRAIPMTVTGSYSGSTDLSKLSLKGQELFKGASLDILGLKYLGAGTTFLFDADLYKAKLMGQSWAAQPTAPPSVGF